MALFRKAKKKKRMKQQVIDQRSYENYRQRYFKKQKDRQPVSYANWLRYAALPRYIKGIRQTRSEAFLSRAERKTQPRLWR